MISKLHWKILLAFLAISLLFLGPSLAGIGILFASGLIINELFQRNQESIGLLFLLLYPYVGIKPDTGYGQQKWFKYIEAINTQGEGRGVFVLLTPQYYINLNLGVFDLSLDLVVGVFFFAYFFYSLFLKYQNYIGIKPFVQIVFAILFIPTIMGFLIAQLRGNDGAMAALRALFVITGFFYAYSFALQKEQYIQRLFVLLKQRYLYLLGFLLIVGLVYNHILFLFLGLAASQLVLELLVYKNKAKALILMLFIGVGTVKSTFTILLIPVVSFLLTYWVLFVRSKKTINILPKIGLLVYFLFLAYVITAPKESIKLQDASTTQGRLYNKIYGDRFFVWSSYLSEIEKTNAFFVIPQGKIILHDMYGEQKEISYGAHNMLIQLLYYYGKFWGFLLFFLLFYFMSIMLKHSVYLPIYLRAMAIGLFSVFIVFGLTGHSIITHAASIFFWLLVGFITGLGFLAKKDFINTRKGSYHV